jgi:error-prone DNA polymerase
METEGRLIADYSRYRAYRRAVSLAYQCKVLKRLGILSATGLRETPHRKLAVVAGCVNTRQRPGTAKCQIFVTLEDETGNSNIIVMPGYAGRLQQGPSCGAARAFLKV